MVLRETPTLSLGDRILESGQTRCVLAEKTATNDRDETRRPMFDEPNARRRVRILVGVDDPCDRGEQHRDENGHEYAAQNAL